MSEKTGAAIIGEALRASGCTHAFGIPGGEVLALMEGLRAAGLEFVLTKHENAAGFMAEGLWHATGAPGVLVATLGPGVANAVNVVANAHQDRVPLLFLTGCVDAAEAETYTHQIFDHQAMLRPVVKASFRAETGAVGAMISKALAIATSGQPGPVHIDVPIGVAEAVSKEIGHRPPCPVATTAPRRDAVLQSARDAIAKAERPLAIAGVDAVNEGAAAAIRSFCDTHQVPLITTYKGKGLMDESHPLSLGGAGLSPKADKIFMPLIGSSDCVLLLGYDPIEMRVGWREPFHAEQTVIEIADVARTHGMHRPTHLLPGRVAPVLDALSEGLIPRRSWIYDEAKAARDALVECFTPGEAFGPGQVFEVLRKVAPPEAVITADSGAHRILLSQMWQCPGARMMLQSTALCTMACSVPIAAGYKMGRADVPVIAFVGDAGLEMGLGELATLRDRQLPVIITVLVDESLALIELKQRGTQRPNLGVDFGGTDFPGLAAALGGHGVWIDDAKALAREAEAALGRGSFTILACRIGRHAYDGTF